MLTYSFWLFEAQRVVYCVESLSMVVSEISSQFKILFRYDKSNADNCESTISPKSNQQYAKYKTKTFHKSSISHAWIRFLTQAVWSRMRSSRQREEIGVQSSAPTFETQTELRGNRVKQTENCFWRHLVVRSGMCTDFFVSLHLVQKYISKPQ